MNKVSQVVKNQVYNQFQQKKKQVILDNLNKHKSNNNNKDSFQEVLNIFLHKNQSIHMAKI